MACAFGDRGANIFRGNTPFFVWIPADFEEQT